MLYIEPYESIKMDSIKSELLIEDELLFSSILKNLLFPNNIIGFCIDSERKVLKTQFFSLM